MTAQEIISLLGIVAGIALFIFLSMKGFQLVITACLASILVLVTSGLPFLETINGTWATGFVSFIKGYFLIMALGALIGKLMADSGASKTIAKAVYTLCGHSKKNQKFMAALFVPIMYVLLSFAGINGMVIIFTVIGIGSQILKEFDLPWRFYCYGGASCVAANFMPGSLATSNIAASTVAGSNVVGNLGFGLVAAVVYLGVAVLLLYLDVRRADQKGEGFMDSGADYAAGLKTAAASEAQRPKLLLSAAPLLVTLFLAAVLQINILYSLFAGNILAVVLYWNYLPNVKKTLGDGVSSSFTPVINIGATSAVATVIAASPGFAVVSRGLGSLPDLLTGVSYVLIFSFIMGAPTASINSVGATAFEFFGQAGLSNGVSARLLGLSTFTTLPPHSSAIASNVSVGKLRYKDVVTIYLKVTLIGGACAMAVCLLLIKLGVFV